MKIIDEIKKQNIFVSHPTGHYRLTSGKHAVSYVKKDMIPTIPNLYNQVIKELHFRTELLAFRYMNKDVVITSPAAAGIVYGSPVAIMGKLPFIYPEKGEWISPELEKQMIFRREFDKFVKGKKVIIIEDIITTGGSVIQTETEIMNCGGEIIGCVAIWNREGWNSNHHNNTKSLIEEKVESHYQDDCPYCQQGVPLFDPKTDKEITV